MFGEVPEWAECSVSSVSALPNCFRKVTKMVSVLQKNDEGEPEFHSQAVCNQHVEVVEAALGDGSDHKPITVRRKDFPDFVQDVLRGTGLL